MKKWIAMLLAVVMTLSLCACGGEKESPYTGKYISVAGTVLGMTMTGKDIEGFSITLDEGGKGTMEVDGDKGDIKYTIEGTKITIKVDGEKIVGTIEDDVIEIEDMLGTGMDLIFAKKGTDAADPAKYLPKEEKAMLGTWTSYAVVNVLGDDASAETDPNGMQLTIEADHTVSVVRNGAKLGTFDWYLLSDEVYLDEMSWKVEGGELIVDYYGEDVYYTYTCSQASNSSAGGADAPAAGGEQPAAPSASIPGGVRYDCFAFSTPDGFFRSDGTYLILGSGTAALSFGGASAEEYSSMIVGVAVILTGSNGEVYATIDNDIVLLSDGSSTYYLVKEGGTIPASYANLTDDSILQDPPSGGSKPTASAQPAAPAVPDAPAAAAPAGGKMGKSTADAEGIVSHELLIEAGNYVKGAWSSHHFDYEEICAMMGGVPGEPASGSAWDEGAHKHTYTWYSDENHGNFAYVSFLVVDDDIEICTSFQYPSGISDTGTPYTVPASANLTGKSNASASGKTSRDGFMNYALAKQELKDKSIKTWFSYDQMKSFFGCDGAPEDTDKWTGDKHCYRWEDGDGLWIEADFAVLSSGEEVYVSGSIVPDLEGKLGLK